jgi:fructose-bisphosphate aldolase, class II
MLVPGRDLLDEAVAKRRAVGSFNTYNLEITRAILQAAEARRAPVFLAVGPGPLDQAGFAPLVQAMLAAAHESKAPVAVHLDHSTSAAAITRCVDAGFTSVMIDGSRLPFAENVALTREAVGAARGVTTEAELGGVAGAEDRSGDQATEIPITDLDEAAHFATETGIDSLAIAIGNAHGLYAGEPRLDFDRLRTLAEGVPAPLVLHGASGISDDDIRRCIALGVRKINVNTEIRVALFASLEDSLRRGIDGYDVTRLFGAAVEAMQRTVEDKLAVFMGE